MHQLNVSSKLHMYAIRYPNMHAFELVCEIMNDLLQS